MEEYICTTCSKEWEMLPSGCLFEENWIWKKRTDHPDHCPNCQTEMLEEWELFEI
ncbi:hypothetical protein LSG31_08970 [Fodinisporobacter ferrooxydans]|uniref:Uncharacterized protein n=1 Tax=Fodinisporobacter ferrooxydans TaxID=2901836 RepID=A0ABY4CKK6_9BACL|nr:hypothetical protein LSG31_01830 [Alicyclobacillaceae bacterium MYW30-H2]UOF92272.1 hypothetical protein LSG31_08970 [Alicyclobacillaceae bacterium MYW30-H2]